MLFDLLFLLRGHGGKDSYYSRGRPEYRISNRLFGRVFNGPEYKLLGLEL